MAHRGQMQRVLIADDQILFRSGVRTLLAAENDMQTVGEAATAGEALLKQHLTAPDVVVMSASLLLSADPAERDQIRHWTARSALVLVTDSDTDERELIREMGSLITIPRSTPALHIVETIRHAGWNDNLDPEGISRTVVGLNALAKAHSTKVAVLTSREQEVVKLLAEGRTVRETAAELSLSAKTIDAHKLNVMRKLDIHNREKLIEYAISQHIIASAPAPPV